jgi:hypothetical protein
MHEFAPISQFKIFHGKTGKALFIVTDVGHVFDCAKGDYSDVSKAILHELTERDVMPSDIPGLIAYDLVTQEDINHLKQHNAIAPEMVMLWENMQELRQKVSEKVESGDSEEPGDDEDHTKWPAMSLEDDHEKHGSGDSVADEFDDWHRDTKENTEDSMHPDWNQPEVVGFEPDLEDDQEIK